MGAFTNRLRGMYNRVIGRSKQGARDIELRGEGRAQELGGRFQEGAGKAQAKTGEALRKAGSSIKRA